MVDSDERGIMTKCVRHPGVVVFGVLAVLVASAGVIVGQENGGTVALDVDDIGGVVTGPHGPEAGVWVIAETSDLPTGFRKIVVTDQQGRYLVPDLPEATYRVWVRGYGLVDSADVTATPGQSLDLTAVVAPDPAAAAAYYPANYWLSLLEVPPKSDFPGTGPQGNGIGENMRSQGDWIAQLRSGCTPCHQLGTKATRELPPVFRTFDSTRAAWHQRVQSGQQGVLMNGMLADFGRDRALELFADWTDRVVAGELPPVPPRPQGLERHVVITQWDWADEFTYVHDITTTDKRDPTVNANGLVYSNDRYNHPDLNILDPVRHTVRKAVTLTVRDPATPHAVPQRVLQPSPYHGEELIWTNQTDMHNPMMDHRGRIWMTQDLRPSAKQPAWCQEGSTHPSAQFFPLANSGRQVSVYDPATGEVTQIDTCFGTHHLQFAADANNTLWFSGGGALGWLDTKRWDETHDAQQSQGWAPCVFDTNGNGRQDAYVEPDEPVDPTKDKRLGCGSYSIIENPADGTIWTSSGGGLYRLDLGSNPPETALAERYEPPWPGYRPRGGDIDRNGVFWTGLASGHLVSFDRRKCAVVRGPVMVTGQHCPEGWTFYQSPGPNFKNVTDPGSADFHYFVWVDQFNTFGLGENVPIAMGSNSDSYLALIPETGQWVILRVPYPVGAFFTRGGDGRIDDPDAGWKGRGLWATTAQMPVWHEEGGKGSIPKAVKFQFRPDPLAK